MRNKLLPLVIICTLPFSAAAEGTLNGFRGDLQPPVNQFDGSQVSFKDGLPLPALETGNSSLPPSGSRIENGANYAMNRQVGKIQVAVDRNGVPADGQSAVHLSIAVLNYQGQPLQGDAIVTVEASAGRLQIPGAATDEFGPGRVDTDRITPGIQVKVINGHADLLLLAPDTPQDVTVRVTAGRAQAQGMLSFVPELRDMLAVGLVEGVIRFDKKSPLQLSGTRLDDGFEQEIQSWSRQSGDGRKFAAARTAFFLKGKIKGDALLTMAFDSDKDTHDRLFRDVRPDAFYPVYGDASVHGFDAQSEGKFYVRVDKEKSYLLYGDFNTGAGFSQLTGGGSVANIRKRDLGNYSRSFNGGRGHYETENVLIDGFVAHDNQMQFVEEFPAQGTSGPFAVSKANALINSEKIEIITRDRFQPAVILSTIALQRYVDYSFEPFSGRILLNQAVPSVDSDGNPKSLRITYEVDTGGENFWVYGVDGQIKLHDRVEVGGSYIQDKNPLAPYRLMSANASWLIADNTSFVTEFARSKSVLGSGFGSGLQNSPYSLQPSLQPIPGSGVTSLQDIHGNAFRAELLHQTEQTQARAYVGRSDPYFNNPAASLTQGREEASLKITHKLATPEENAALAAWTAYVGANHTKDRAANAFRNAGEIGAAYQFNPRWDIDLAVTHTQEQAGDYLNAPLSLGSGLLVNPQNTYGFGTSMLNPQSGYGLNGTNYGLAGIHNNSTGLRARTNYALTQNVDLMGEYEHGVKGDNYHRAAVGAAYRFSELGRFYGKYEWLNALASPSATSDAYKSSAFVFGVENEYQKNQQVFSEYRMRDAISASDLLWASGLRNAWDVSEQLRLSSSAEYLHAYRGSTASATALTGAAEWRPTELLLLGGRLEWRRTQDSTISVINPNDPDATPTATTTHGNDTYLSTLTAARKLDRDWTFLGRNYLLYTDNRGHVGNLWENRLQLGIAYRDTDTNRFDALARYEFWVQRDKSGLAYSPVNGINDPFSGNAGSLGEGFTKHIISLHGNYHPSRPWWFAGHAAAKWQKDIFSGTNGSMSDTYSAYLLSGRATYDISKRWDISALAAALYSPQGRATQYALGAEAGYQVQDNLWMSTGYNFRGFRADDMSGADYTNQGVYLRLRFKFDEDLFGARG